MLWKSKKAIGRSFTTKPQTSVPKSPMLTPYKLSKHKPAKLQTPTSKPQTPTSLIQTPTCVPPRQPEMQTGLTSDCPEVDRQQSLHVSTIMPVKCWDVAALPASA